VLDRLRQALRERGYVPMMLDSEPAESRDVTETVRTLAGLSRFVVVDLSDPRSVPHELQSFVPFTAVPVIPIIRAGQEPYALFGDFRKYEWVLDQPATYRDADDLLRLLSDGLLAQGEALADRVAVLRRG
jgi:hypothetical protein